MITLTFSQMIIAAIFMIAAVTMAIVYRELYRKRSEQYIYYRRAFDTASKNNDLLEAEIRRLRPVRDELGRYMKRMKDKEIWMQDEIEKLQAIITFSKYAEPIAKFVKEEASKIKEGK